MYSLIRRLGFPCVLFFLCLQLLFGFGDALGGSVVDVRLVEQSGQSRVEVPVTFGQVFSLGDVPNGLTLAAVDLAGNEIPLQVDTKARHADGSLRHAILTLIMPGLPANGSERVDLRTAPEGAGLGAITPDALLSTAYDVNVFLDIGGSVYTASARELLQRAVSSNNIQSWLAGPLVSEWLVMSPVKDNNGNPHPHLTVRFNIRAHAGMGSIRTAVIIRTRRLCSYL